MERFLDPGWAAHEAAGELLAELLVELDSRGGAALDSAEAVRGLVSIVRDAVADGWLPRASGERLEDALQELATAIAERDGLRPAGAPRLYAALEAPAGLPGRPWYRNRFWAPGLETGYAAETLPSLRSAAGDGQALEKEVESLVQAVLALGSAWRGE